MILLYSIVWRSNKSRRCPFIHLFTECGLEWTTSKNSYTRAFTVFNSCYPLLRPSKTSEKTLFMVSNRHLPRPQIYDCHGSFKRSSSASMSRHPHSQEEITLVNDSLKKRHAVVGLISSRFDSLRDQVNVGQKQFFHDD